MNSKRIKREIFYLKKAFLEYHQGWRYIKNRYFLAPKILKLNKILEKPINNHDLSIHVLTGHRDLLMLIWALASFYNVAKNIGHLHIHSDGTLTESDIKKLNKFFPSAKVVNSDDFLSEYESELKEYPVIKKFRTDYPEYFLLKKIIDPYFSSPKIQRLIVDSDLLWFRNPDQIEKNIGGSKSLMMLEKKQGAGYAVYFKDLTRLDKSLTNFNSGIVMYRKQDFDLKKLTEYLDKIDVNNKGNQHFIEQNAYAYCLNNLAGLNTKQYHFKGPANEETIVKHYTAPRRLLFYTEGLEIMKDRILN